MSTAIKVIFYPLKQAERPQVMTFACRLAEKAIQLGHRTHLLAGNESEARQLDDLLWHFRPDSFLPHALLLVNAGRNEPATTRLTLGTRDQCPVQPDVLINLSDSVWDHHTGFKDIRELVPADPDGRARGRERYRAYQELGYNVETLQV